MSDDQLAQLRNKQIGFVFQAFNLIPRLPALRQVSLPLMYAGVSRAEREARAVQMLEMVGLGDRMDHRPDQLSGGQQQRVAIARALGMSPTLLLADEPTGNLDTASGLEIMALFKKLNEEGKTIIMITHEHEIADQTRRKIQLRDGIILSDTENGHHKQAKSKH
jgi:putative ABC transport system ATP-binding protein